MEMTNLIFRVNHSNPPILYITPDMAEVIAEGISAKP